MKHAAKFLILVILTEILSGCTRPPPFSLISPIHDKRHWKCKIIHDVDVKALKAKEKRATIPHASATKSFHRVDLTPFGVLKQKIHKCKHDGCNWDWIPRKKKASKLGLVEVFRIDIIKVARIGTEVCSRGSEQKISPAWGSWGDDGWEKVLIHETQIYKSNPDDPYNTFWIDVEWALKDKINKMVDKAGRRIWKYREVNSKFLHLETKEGLPVAMVEYGLDYRTGNE